jgi:hypothetical protein
MAMAVVASANGKNGAGPRLCTATAPSATETGKTPKLQSIGRPVSRPSSAGGAHRWNAVIITTLPKPFSRPKAASAAPAGIAPPR